MQTRWTLTPLVVALVFCGLMRTVAGQDSTPPQSALELLEAGAAAWEAGEFSDAAALYGRAIDAYIVEAEDDPASADTQVLVLRRAILWCHVRAGTPASMPPHFQPFFDTLRRTGKASDEVPSVRNAVAAGNMNLAKAGKADELDAVFNAFHGAIDAAATAAAADIPRKAELEPLIDQLDELLWSSRHDHMESLFVVGKTDAGKAEFGAIARHFAAAGRREQAIWTAQNGFYEMTQNGKTADAAFFFTETLAGLKDYTARLPLSYLLVNVRNYLKALQDADQTAGAVAFINAVIETAGPRRLYIDGVDELTLRMWLVPLLRNGAVEHAVTNGDKLAALGKAAGNAWAESIGWTAAAQELLAADKPDDGRAAKAVAVAAGCGSPSTHGRALIAHARSLTALNKFELAEADVIAALELLRAAADTPGTFAANQAGLANAEATDNAEWTARYESALRRASAGGGMGGRNIGTMSAADLVEKSGANPLDMPLIEISRNGDTLTVTNLLDSTSTDLTISPRFYYLSISGVLIQLRGAEFAIDNIYDKANAPGTMGESVAIVGGELIYDGPQFHPFALRAVVAHGGRVQITSGQRVIPIRPR